MSILGLIPSWAWRWLALGTIILAFAAYIHILRDEAANAKLELSALKLSIKSAEAAQKERNANIEKDQIEAREALQRSHLAEMVRQDALHAKQIAAIQAEKLALDAKCKPLTTADVSLWNGAPRAPPTETRLPEAGGPARESTDDSGCKLSDLYKAHEDDRAALVKCNVKVEGWKVFYAGQQRRMNGQ